MTERTRRQTLEAFAKACGREAHILARRPDLLGQQLANRLQWDDAEPRRLCRAHHPGRLLIRPSAPAPDSTEAKGMSLDGGRSPSAALSPFNGSRYRAIAKADLARMLP